MKLLSMWDMKDFLPTNGVLNFQRTELPGALALAKYSRWCREMGVDENNFNRVSLIMDEAGPFFVVVFSNGTSVAAPAGKIKVRNRGMMRYQFFFGDGWDQLGETLYTLDGVAYGQLDGRGGVDVMSEIDHAKMPRIGFNVDARITTRYEKEASMRMGVIFELV